MDLKRYFHDHDGLGFLSTANTTGEIDIAVYARPRVLEDGTVVFGMSDRLMHANLTDNPHATYAFHEGGYDGVRLFLDKVKEENEGAMLDSIRTTVHEESDWGMEEEIRYAVYFRVNRELPLVQH